MSNRRNRSDAINGYGWIAAAGATLIAGGLESAANAATGGGGVARVASTLAGAGAKGGVALATLKLAPLVVAGAGVASLGYAAWKLACLTRTAERAMAAPASRSDIRTP